MILLPNDRPKIDFKRAKVLDKIDQMLAKIKQEQPSTSALHNEGVVITELSFEKSLDDNSSIKFINFLQSNFQDIYLNSDIAKLF